MPLTPGEPAPWFVAPTPSNPEFRFDSAGGRFVLLAFAPAGGDRGAEALRALAANRALFDDVRLSAFVVVRDPQSTAGARDMRGLRWFLDTDGAISRLYGALDAEGGEHPMWILLDPTLRVLGARPLNEHQAVFDYLPRLGPPAGHAGVPMHPPVLIVPRVFDPELCARMVALHDAQERDYTGVMRDAGERTVAVMDEAKKRRDVLVEAAALRDEIRTCLERRLFPMIERAYAFAVTGIERYVISRYDAAEGGIFRAHRDNVTKGTAHRKFACSINLNDGFEGGDLRFAEYGPETFRPPVGGAIVFSSALLHEVTPMTSGRRYAFLPFFYDPAGAEVLEAYRRGVQGSAA